MIDTPITTTTVESDKPFTPEEENVMELLIQANNAFIALPNQSKYAVASFTNHIHDCQRILCMRTMKRLFPDYHPIVD